MHFMQLSSFHFLVVCFYVALSLYLLKESCFFLWFKEQQCDLIQSCNKFIYYNNKDYKVIAYKVMAILQL